MGLPVDALVGRWLRRSRGASADTIVQWMRLSQGAIFGIDGGQQLVEG